MTGSISPNDRLNINYQMGAAPVEKNATPAPVEKNATPACNKIKAVSVKAYNSVSGRIMVLFGKAIKINVLAEDGFEKKDIFVNKRSLAKQILLKEGVDESRITNAVKDFAISRLFPAKSMEGNSLNISQEDLSAIRNHQAYTTIDAKINVANIISNNMNLARQKLKANIVKDINKEIRPNILKQVRLDDAIKASISKKLPTDEETVKAILVKEALTAQVKNVIDEINKCLEDVQRQPPKPGQNPASGYQSFRSVLINALRNTDPHKLGEALKSAFKKDDASWCQERHNSLKLILNIDDIINGVNQQDIEQRIDKNRNARLPEFNETKANLTDCYKCSDGDLRNAFDQATELELNQRKDEINELYNTDFRHLG